MHGIWANKTTSQPEWTKMGISVWQVVIVVILIVLLFGRGKISDLMGDVAKGITSFRKGLKDGDSEREAADAAASKTIDNETGDTVNVSPDDKAANS